MEKNKEDLYIEYIELLDSEIKSLLGLATVHGWKSDNVEKGIELRAKIAEADRIQTPPPIPSIEEAAKAYAKTTVASFASYSFKDGALWMADYQAIQQPVREKTKEHILYDLSVDRGFENIHQVFKTGDESIIWDILSPAMELFASSKAVETQHPELIKEVESRVINCILDDIDFGYTTDMIKGKMESGSYVGNSHETFNENQQGWIDIQSELPNDGRDILLGDIESGIVATGFMSFQAEGFIPDRVMTVTHWKELSEPPTKTNN